MALLEVDDIHTYYGQSHVLQGVSLSIEEGSVVTLLGRNGAGKTTTLRSIMGLTPPRRGEIRLRGEDITADKPERISRAGVSLVPEDREVFPSLTVRENLKLGGIAHEAAEGQLDQVCEYFPRLAERLTQQAGQMSGGEQQMLAIGRALMADPDVLMLDEPSEGLAPNIVDTVVDIVEEINSDGVTVLLVEQNLEVAVDLGDYHNVIENGQMVFSGDSEELLEKPEFVKEKLGVSMEGPR
jgi:branched-chain amino acid transport system ATP-binding protein